MKTKLCYIISKVDKAIAFEWIVDSIDREKFELSFILLNDRSSHIEEYLRANGVIYQRVTYKGKKDIFKTISSIYRFLRKKNINVVHTHLFEATLLGLLAGKLAGVQKRIYTRHHSTYHHLYARKGVMFDRLINWMATDIIAISENVRHVLQDQEKVRPQKIHDIRHGFKIKDFQEPSAEKIRKIETKYNTTDKRPVIGVIGRWIEWKGIQYTIAAFQKLLLDYPDALLILANAKGSYSNEIRNILSSLDPKSYQSIVFEEDLFSLYHLFDVFVHVPIDPKIEAFGQTYVEAMAAGIPSVFTLSGIAHEFVIHKKNALAVPFRDSDEIYFSIKEILENEDLRKRLIENGQQSVEHQFTLNKMITELTELYVR